MAHLGRGEYALMLHLSDGGRLPTTDNGTRTRVGDAEFRTSVVKVLVDAGLATRIDNDGVAEIELSETGRAEFDRALAIKWVVDHSGLHEESKSYRFEVPDPVTGRRFVVAVPEDAGPAMANRVAYGVIATPSVKESCRKIEAIGPEGGFQVQTAADGAGEIAVWRKL